MVPAEGMDLSTPAGGLPSTWLLESTGGWTALGIPSDISELSL